jgi:XTP/dITP diphosphohydrolase
VGDVGARPLLVATRNQGKLREFRRMLVGLPYQLATLDDAGIEFDVEETGSTFEENARAKAEEYALASGLLTLADDSGLEVDALGGEPGVLSARYAGAHGDDEANNRLLLASLNGTPSAHRTARYRIVIALVDPRIKGVTVVEGECEGLIAMEPSGDNGFGYDPLFYLPAYRRTMAELPPDEKDRISHRGVAAGKLALALRGMVN